MVALEEEVLNMMEDRPELSRRQIANTLIVCSKLIWKILKDQQLYRYHIQSRHFCLEIFPVEYSFSMQSSIDYPK